jgi:hypothetical protein
MKILAPPEAEAFVRERGGHLYVWTDRTRCCGGAMTLLQTSMDPPERGGDFHEFVGEGFKLSFDSGRLAPPDELHLALKGWRRKRIDAFWNGCAYIDQPVLSRSPGLKQD